MFIRFAVIAAIAAILSACGGGGGGGTSISVNPSSLTFQAVQGDYAPAAQTIRVSYSGDGALVGFPPGVQPPSWLSLASQDTGPGSGTLLVTVAAPDTVPQSLSTTLRFVTGHADGSDIKTVDVPVTYRITTNPLTISAQPNRADFTAVSEGAAPAAQALSVMFSGSQSEVDPSSVPSWLNVTPANSATNPQAYTLVPNTTDFAPGTQLSASLVFRTTAAGHLYSKTTTVAVTYGLSRDFAVTAPAMAFTGVDTASTTQPAAGYAVSVLGDHANWTTSADQAWVKFSPASGMGPGTITVTANSSGLGSGIHSATLTVSDSVTGRSQSFPLSLTLHAARLVVNPAAATISVDSTTPSSGLHATLAMTDELGGANASQAVQWSVASIDAPWLKWSPTNGSTSPASHATVSLETAQLAKFAAGDYSGTVTLNYTSADGTGGTQVVPVTLHLQLPLVRSASYYVATANVAGSLIARGQDFALAGGNPLMIGAIPASGASMDSATQFTVPFDALPAGRYRVQFQNAAGIPRGPELVVLAPRAMSYQAIPTSSGRSRLIYDPERNMLYGVNSGSGQLEIYRFASGKWSASPALAVAKLEDAALSPDGSMLVATSDSSMVEIDLTKNPPVAKNTAPNPDGSCGGFLDGVAMANDGKYFVTYNYHACSGFSPSYLYDSLTKVLTQSAPYPNDYFSIGTVEGSADGSRAYIGNNGVSPEQPVSIFNSLADSLTDSRTDLTINAEAVSRDASRVILDGTLIYDRDLTKLGNIPASGASIPSPDGTRAYAYSNSSGTQPVLEIYDLTAHPTATNYPLIKTIPLADDPGGYPLGARLTVSADGQTVFISGASAILVVPVQ